MKEASVFILFFFKKKTKLTFLSILFINSDRMCSGSDDKRSMWFEPNGRHCIVSLSMALYPLKHCLVLKSKAQLAHA